MKRPETNSTPQRMGMVFGLILLTGLFAGCATKAPKEATALQRGWIGGEYRLAEKPRWFGTKGAMQAFPAGLDTKQKTGVLITALSSNTPARLAGLRAGDLVLQANREPVRTLKDFRKIVDHSSPGTELSLKVCRDGQISQCNVTVGRETFRPGGLFVIGLPVALHGPDLWPNPDFSLIAAGYKRDRSRVELDSIQETYRRSCDPKGYQAVDGNWRVWLVIMEVSTHKKILSQENVAPTMVLARGDGAE